MNIFRRNVFIRSLGVLWGVLLSGCATVGTMPPEFKEAKGLLAGLKSVQLREGQDPEVAFAVAVSGGGHRAANLAVGVFEGLEAVKTPRGNLLQEVDYFSTTSGGGFAVGSYLAARFDYQRSGVSEPFCFATALRAEKERGLKDLRRDYQSSILVQWLNWRCIGFRDAGDLIERRFDRYLLGSKYRADKTSLVLGDLFVPSDSAASVRFPYWVANATVYENGARFMFTPEFVRSYRIGRYVHNMRYATLDDPFELPLSVGMKSSASFPVLIPATTLTCGDSRYLHLFDGGLTDNLGVETALELLENDAAPRKVLLIVDAYTKNDDPYSAHRKSPDGAGAAYRVMNIGLDAEHLTLHRDVEARAAEGAIEVLFVDFEPFSVPLEAELEEAFECSREIPTSLYISAADQAALMQTGRHLALLQEESLRQCFSNPLPAGNGAVLEPKFPEGFGGRIARLLARLGYGYVLYQEATALVR